MKNLKKLKRDELKNVVGSGHGDWQLYCDPNYSGSGSPKGTCNSGYI
ncbi:bacteriocin-like protein, partial [Chryseobacterium piscium]